jgi:hypothetical protein
MRTEEIIPAIKRDIQKTKEGIPVLLESSRSKEAEVSRQGTSRTFLPPDDTIGRKL